MNAWPGNDDDIMGPTVTRAATPHTPRLKNGGDLRGTGYLVAVGSRTARFRRKHKNKVIFIIILVLFLLLLCLSIVMTILYVRQKRNKPVRICESRECLRAAANLALSMDRTADPCQDFYQYACGNWATDHPRPDTYNSYDWFRDKQTKVYALVRDFLSKNTSNQPLPVLQAKDMYAACMDTETLDKLGLKPIFKILSSVGLPPYPVYINSTENNPNYSFDWLETVIKIKTYLNMDVLIGFDIFTDPKNSSVYRLVMGSPETTNPFPSLRKEKLHYNSKRNVKSSESEFINHHKHYTESEKNKDDEEDERLEHIHKLFYAELMKIFVIESIDPKNMNLTEAELDENIIVVANEYYNINDDMYELEIYNDTETDEDLYLKIPEYSVDEIQAHTDMIVESNNGTVVPIWKKYLNGVFSISDVSLHFDIDKILVSEPDLKYMSLMASYVSKLTPATVELYIWVKVVEVLSIHTTTELRSIFKRSYDQVHHHRDAGSPPRSLQCANAVNDLLGMAVAYAIVDTHFLNVTKPKIQIMLDELKNALAHLVGKAKWMDDDTKLATYQKITEMKSLIGFPEWLLEEGRIEDFYSGIEVNRETHLENMINIIQVKIRKVLNRYRQGNNVTWATDPTEVNAYHTFQENTITVPLVMLQYPFFDLGLDSLNYGSLGAVLGHEITHGFDNFGRQFDKNGNLLPWWSNNTINSFVNMTQCFVEQYSNYYVPELDEYVNGKKTLGENIADNGGLRESLAALKHYLQKHGPEDKLPGFEHLNSEQLFFLSFGNLWCGVSTKDSLRGDLEDEHSPQVFRAQGALQNSEEFASAFRCPPGSPMNPEQKCIIF